MRISICVITALTLTVTTAIQAAEIKLKTNAARIKNIADVTINVGGVVEIPGGTLHPVIPGNNATQCDGLPFTEEEVERVASAAIREVTVTATDGKRMIEKQISLPARNDKPARTIALKDYVEELNRTESFFNIYGVTLRSGPYQDKRRSNGSGLSNARAVVCKSRDSISGVAKALPLLRFKLTDPPPAAHEFNPDPSDLPQTTPNRPKPGDMMGNVSTHVSSPRINPGSLNAEGLSHVTQSQMFKDLLPNKSRKISRFTGPSCPSCTFDYPNDIWLTNEGLALVNDPNFLIDSNFLCVDTKQHYELDDDRCPLWARSYYSKTTRKMVWSQKIDVDAFLKNYTKPCQLKDALGPYFSELYYFDPSSEGDVVATQGTASLNFFDGTLTYNRNNIRSCLFDSGSNGFFDATACLGFNSKNQFSPEQGFLINNDAGLRLGATLFGISFDFINGKNVSEWKQSYVANGTNNAVFPDKSSTLPTTTKTFHTNGPKAVFAIGPVPLSVSSYADANINIAAPTYPFSLVPLNKNQEGTGKVGAGVGVSSNVTVSMNAAIDAFVLSAGIEGQLSLLSASINGEILSTINPKKNDWRVIRSFGAKGESLKSKILAFVEVDLILYSERYDIEIASFGGLDANIPMSSTEWGPFNAVVPASAKSGSICPN